jgi:hypothetical protein
MSQRLLDFELDKLVNHAIDEDIRRKENYRFSRKRFDLDNLIDLIRADDQTDEIEAEIDIITDYESFSHVGTLFGDRELGILGFLMKKKFDHLNQARAYMADMIFRNPYLSPKQREEHPEALIIIRKQMF